jgi:hypothetical protein
MPLEIIPNDSDRGFATVPVYPVSGSRTYIIHGHTPAPTPTDGFHVTATVDIDAVDGAVVTRLVIEPSTTIQEGGRHRPREREEKRLSPVNTATLTRIKFTDIINRIAEVEMSYAQAVADVPAVSDAIEERIADLRKRGPRKDQREHARWARQALASMRQGRGYQARLEDLYPRDWTMTRDGIKKRISRLRADGWLHTEYGRSGPVLDQWRSEHPNDHSYEEDL